jgi:hypothetical protein
MSQEVAVMATVEVFDPPMCCSTGVCVPSVDPALADFAADLAWLSDQGVHVERHNLSQEPGPFAESDVVRSLLSEHGDAALPVVVVEGELFSSGRYPSRDELAAALPGIEAGAVEREEGNIAAGCCGGAPAADVPLVNAGATSSGSSGCCG